MDILGEFFSAESEDDVTAHTGLAARMDDVTADLASISRLVAWTIRRLRVCAC